MPTSGFLVILSSFYQSVAIRKNNFWKGIVEHCFTSRITANCEQPIHSFPHFYEDYLPNFITHWNTSFQQVTINDTYIYIGKSGVHNPPQTPTWVAFTTKTSPDRPQIQPLLSASLHPVASFWTEDKQEVVRCSSDRYDENHEIDITVTLTFEHCWNLITVAWSFSELSSFLSLKTSTLSFKMGDFVAMETTLMVNVFPQFWKFFNLSPSPHINLAF